jgi:hypothetical protein
MNQSGQQKNWQWRVIIYASLFLLLAKPIGHWAYQLIGIEQIYASSTEALKRTGLSDVVGVTTPAGPPPELIIDVKNDTPNNYTVETKISSGQIDLLNRTMVAGEVKRITVKPYSKLVNPVGRGDIIFLSEPVSGSNNQICQEIHTFNYDLKNAGQIKQPLAINLSAISSKMDCKESKDSAVLPSDDESNH